VNAYEALAALGLRLRSSVSSTDAYGASHLLVHGEASSWCQPCMSPVWDTALAALALQEVADKSSHSAADRALDWLVSRQIPDGEPGDWRAARPEARGGGWAFQFANPHYPDSRRHSGCGVGVYSLQPAGTVCRGL